LPCEVSHGSAHGLGHAVRGGHNRQSGPCGGDCLPYFRGRQFHPDRRGHVVDMNSLEIEVEVNEAQHQSYPSRTASPGDSGCLSRVEDPGACDCDHSNGGSQQDNSEGADSEEQKDRRILPDMGVQVSFLEEAKGTRKALLAVGADGHPQGYSCPAPRWLNATERTWF
jgi:hypothetical protein